VIRQSGLSFDEFLDHRPLWDTSDFWEIEQIAAHCESY
jgi:hypothetical protein